MEDTLYFSGMLMAIGMTTVFIILALVVLGGKLTIIITNKLAPVAETLVVRSVSSANLESSKIAAITAAIETVTQGKGHIQEIKKN